MMKILGIHGRCDYTDSFVATLSEKTIVWDESLDCWLSHTYSEYLENSKALNSGEDGIIIVREIPMKFVDYSEVESYYLWIVGDEIPQSELEKDGKFDVIVNINDKTRIEKTIEILLKTN